MVRRKVITKSYTHVEWRDATGDINIQQIWDFTRPVRESEKFTITISRFSRKCEFLDISQPYITPRPVNGIVLFLYVDDAQASQETLTSTA
jgi:hypothetical protein